MRRLTGPASLAVAIMMAVVAGWTSPAPSGADPLDTRIVVLRPPLGAPTPSPESPLALPGWDRAEDAPVVAAVPMGFVKANSGQLPVPGHDAIVAGSVGGADAGAANVDDNYVYFNYDSTFYARIRGRDMRTRNTVFCNDFVGEPENAEADPYTEIQLVLNVDNGPDKYYERLRYPNDGQQWGWCWRGHSNHLDYHFDYVQPDTYWRVHIHGVVDGQ